jgi:type I restriction enzyme S subunit
MSYKTLGDYIQPVNIRNKDLEVTTLLGVSIRKVLMPSIANTIGTNMKTYKIIKQNQFAYGPVTSRNGDKISIALLEEHEIAIVSQAYTVFEVIDEQEVLPEYLMMWFRRTEFDRFSRFKSHGSAREVFDWEELCDTRLPIPSIEKQQLIVNEYNTVTNRIHLNNQLNQKLEKTAQALYKHWFVDFEFPNTENKPYKSSGGLMVYNEELEKDIPIGWSVERLSKYY